MDKNKNLILVYVPVADQMSKKIKRYDLTNRGWSRKKPSYSSKVEKKSMILGLDGKSRILSLWLDRNMPLASPRWRIFSNRLVYTDGWFSASITTIITVSFWTF